MAILGLRDTPVLVPFGEIEYADRLRGLDPFNDANAVRIVGGEQPMPFCVVEHVGAMPGQGVSSCFSFGRNFGFILGLLTAFRIPYELVRPQKWKREFSCTSDKNTSIEVAQRLYPGVDLRRTPKCVKPHDGICEALLMACYGQRMRSGDRYFVDVRKDAPFLKGGGQ